MAPTLDDITNPLSEACTPIPSHGADVCAVCHGPVGTEFEVCFGCHRNRESLDSPCELVVPVSLVTKIDDQLYSMLVRYKHDNVPDRVRRSLRLRLVALIARLIRDHESCVTSATGTAWDAIAVVPSTNPDAPLHPLASALSHIPELHERFRPVLVRGEAELRHNEPDNAAYDVTSDVSDTRFLVLDDTWVTGAHAQSAATALHRAGADVLAIMPIGRLVEPEFADFTREYWDRQRREAFDFDACCIHA